MKGISCIPVRLVPAFHFLQFHVCRHPSPSANLPSSHLSIVSFFPTRRGHKTPLARHFDSQGEIEARGPWESCVLFCIISIYRRTNVPVLQEHDWPVKQQHSPSKPRSSPSLHCRWKTPGGAHLLLCSFSPSFLCKIFTLDTFPHFCTVIIPPLLSVVRGY